jgi:hypothetical protein
MPHNIITLTLLTACSRNKILLLYIKLLDLKMTQVASSYNLFQSDFIVIATSTKRNKLLSAVKGVKGLHVSTVPLLTSALYVFS